MRTQRALGRLSLASRLAAPSSPFSYWCCHSQQALTAVTYSSFRRFSSSPVSHLKDEQGNLPFEPSLSTVRNENAGKEGDVGFAFDIDGVLYRGGDPISGATEALRALQRQKFRYMFLTNGGGVREAEKAESLHKKLKFQEGEAVIGDRVIQSHTPKQGWPAHIKENDTVLVTGQKPHRARQIAKAYGFKNVLTPADIERACPEIYPFMSFRHCGHIEGNWNRTKQLPRGKRVFTPQDPYSTDIPEDALKIDHVFVWNDPRDWSLDIQLITDVLMSHKGYVGTYSSKNGDRSLPNNGWQQDDQPCLWISNLDLHWKTQYPINRFGTGAFVEAIKGVWRAATDGVELQYNALGKPLQVTYEYAHDRLLRMRPSGEPNTLPASLRRVYMIGDNPESDISGANGFNPDDGTEWKSILVRTGVWHPTAMEPEPRHKPDAIVYDVVDAIVWALNNEGIEMTREKLLEVGAAKSEEPKLEEVTMPMAPVGRIVV